MLERQRNDLGVKLANDWNERVNRERAELQTRYDQGLAVVAKYIPDWSQNYADKLTDFGSKQYSVSKEQLKQVQLIAPGLVACLDDAHKFRQLLEKQRARAKAPEAPPPVPVTTVGTRRSPASSDPRDSDDIETWMKKRNMQVIKRRQAGLR
jgi:hypothetical protein